MDNPTLSDGGKTLYVDGRGSDVTVYLSMSMNQAAALITALHSVEARPGHGALLSPIINALQRAGIEAARANLRVP